MFGGKKKDDGDEFDKQYEDYLKKRDKELEIKQPQGPVVESTNKNFSKDQNIGALSPFDADFEGGVGSAFQGIKK